MIESSNAGVNTFDPEPFKLKWVRQGKVAWQRDWIDKYGPSRSHIPGLDEHISYANFDLKRNSLPTIVKDSAGELYIMAIRPLTEEEMVRTRTELLGHFGHQERAGHVFIDQVLQPLADLASALDVVAYHGFMPAEDSPGLRHLRKMFPPDRSKPNYPMSPAGL